MPVILGMLQKSVGCADKGVDDVLQFCMCTLHRFEGITREDIPHGMGVMIFGNGTGGGFHFRDVKVCWCYHSWLVEQSIVSFAALTCLIGFSVLWLSLLTAVSAVTAPHLCIGQ